MAEYFKKNIYIIIQFKTASCLVSNYRKGDTKNVYQTFVTANVLTNIYFEFFQKFERAMHLFRFRTIILHSSWESKKKDFFSVFHIRFFRLAFMVLNLSVLCGLWLFSGLHWFWLKHFFIITIERSKTRTNLKSLGRMGHISSMHMRYTLFWEL